MDNNEVRGFSKAVVIFIDILGSQNREGFAEWYNIMKIFSDTVIREKSLDDAHPHTVYKREIHVFSDCAYIIYDYKPGIEEHRKDTDALMCIACYNTEKVLFEFLRNGFLARGALTYGDLYYDTEHGIWFGPAMNRAFKLESQCARYPRVIIDPELASGLVAYNSMKYGGFFTNGEILKKDIDGEYFIHYLNTYQLGFNRIENQSLPETVLALYDSEISKKRDNVKLENSIREKYTWLKRYFLESQPEGL